MSLNINVYSVNYRNATFSHAPRSVAVRFQILLVCFHSDVSCRSSFENCTHWLQEAEKFGTVPGNVKMIVANKTDAVRKQAVLSVQGAVVRCAWDLICSQ